MKWMSKALQVAACCSVFSVTLAIAETNDNVITTGFSQADQQALTPREALNKLKAGNDRFVNNDMREYDYSKITDAVETSQFPYAIVLSCIDSRTAPDIIFDQGLGNIFTARVAGNVADTNMLGSFEYATKYAGSKLVVVMGHTNCGAVKGACADVGTGNLKKLLNEIEPAVKMVKKKSDKGCKDSSQITNIAKQNVINQVKQVYHNSKKLRDLVKNEKILLVGAMHDLSTDKVDFFYEYDKSVAESI